MTPYYSRELVTLYEGDCREVMAALPENSIDAIVTDPPYDLTAGKKGGSGEASVNLESPYGRARITTGFMGKRWDGTGVAFDVETWAAAYRVLKPGAHLVAFGAPRTYHRMACAIEDAGFEIRDCLMWLFGSGFPKSLNLHGAWEGWGTALKPAYEPIVLARKPLRGTVAGNVAAWGVGGLNIDGCRIEGGGNKTFTRDAGDRLRDQYRTGTTIGAATPSDKGRWPANVILGHDERCYYWSDCDCRGGHRFDCGSRLVVGPCVSECPVAQLDAQAPATGAFAPVRGTEPTADGFSGLIYGSAKGRQEATFYGDSGGASRFFYTAKTSKTEREFGLADLEPHHRLDSDSRDPESIGANNPRNRANERRNDHPTVKPNALMRWLCRLVTPPGGVILDPFLGSGSTGMAALDEGFRFVGIDLEAHYLDIAQRRITRRHVIEPMPPAMSGQEVLL